MRKAPIFPWFALMLLLAAPGFGKPPAGGKSPVVVDSTLRTPNFQPLGPDYTVSVADHGLLGPKGRNAYFSFSQLDIPAGSSVSFVGPGGVRNVLARVTGPDATHVNGALRSSIQGANFFLLNPNGIVIGPGASFDLPGSLVLTTADEIRFPNATFSARGGGNAPAGLLTSANPIAFGFLSRAPARISISNLKSIDAPTAGTGKTLSLVAGGIDLTRSTLHAAAGRMNVAAVAGPGEVTLGTGLKSGFTIAAGVPLGDVSLADQSALDLGDGGSLYLRAGNLSIDRSAIAALNQDTPGRKAIDLRLSGALEMTHEAQITAENRGAFPGADIRIDAASVHLANFGRIQAGVGQPNDGGHDPNASALNALATGPAGGIRIHAGSLLVEDRGVVSSLIYGPGRGADIDISVDGAATIIGPRANPRRPEHVQAIFTGIIIKTDDRATASQASGGLTFTAADLTMLRGADLSSTTKTSRPAGDVRVNADRIHMDGRGRLSLTGIEARAGEAPTATGAGGSIIVRGRAGGESSAESLTLVDGATLSASTFGRGTGGNVDVRAKDVRIVGRAFGFTGLFARSAAAQPELGPAGAGGSVSVMADTVHLSRAASIAASSRGAGNAGSVLIDARRLTLDHSSVSAAAIRAPSAGDVTVRNALSVEILNGSALTTQAGQDGGNISITARDMVRVDHSLLTAQSGAAGKTLTIDPKFIVLNDATINGVDLNKDLTVSLIADNFLRTPAPGTQILTSLPPQLPPDVDLSNKVIPLQAPTLEAAARLLEACHLRVGGEGVSSFLITGRGGTPVAPGGTSPSR